MKQLLEPDRQGWKLAAFTCALLVLIAVVYLPVVNFDFVNYDDPDYVTNNPHVRAGLTTSGAFWALSSRTDGNWIPMTWLSHMLVCQLFGMNPGAHHLTNVGLHAVSTVLLFSM